MSVIDGNMKEKRTGVTLVDGLRGEKEATLLDGRHSVGSTPRNQKIERREIRLTHQGEGFTMKAMKIHSISQSSSLQI